MDKVLITGTTGFVGSNLISFLNSSSYSIVQVNRSNKDDKLDCITYNEMWTNSSFNARHYIHLAGKAHDLKNTSDDSEYFRVNYELTKKLYDQFLEDKKAKTFIFISSVKAIADKVQGSLTEDHQPNPISAYGRSKLKAEKYILENLPNKRKVIILRPCMIHGPGNKGNLNLLHSIISKGLPWPLGLFKNSRSFLSIDNLCYIIKKILENDLPSGVYNLADDDAVSTTELVSIISKISNKKSRILNVSKFLIQTIAKVGNVIPLPLNEERLEKLTENYLVSNEKIKKMLGMEVMPLTAEEGLIKTIQSFAK